MALRWHSIIYFSVLHLLFLYALTLADRVSLSTWLLTLLHFQLSCLGVTAGAHRLWSHKSYSASPALRTFLIAIQSSAVQMAIVSWARIHRLHHRYTDQDLDPHNINRGFWFSHLGWLLIRPTPAVKAALEKVDLSDLLRDPALVRQRQYFIWYALFWGVIVPLASALAFGEDLLLAFLYVVVVRLVLTYHVTWCINSVAHTFGTQPYTTKNQSRQNWLLALVASGEGHHNYHHNFPGDYRASEGWWLNSTMVFIDAMMWLGWAEV